MTNKKMLSLLLAFCCTACIQGRNTQTATVISTDTVVAFTLPAIPPTLRTPELRAGYLVEHYWESLNFANPRYALHPEITEQAWADYVNILPLIPKAQAEKSLQETLRKAEAAKENYLYLCQLAEKYLNDHASPARNEELFIAALDAQIHSSVLSDDEKIRPEMLRKLAQKNRIGTKAADFSYRDANKKKRTLYKTAVPYTLLFFHNPECHSCQEAEEELKQAPAINRLMSENRLQIIKIFPEGELPEDLYIFNGMPSFYLLDADKLVLIKDGNVAQVENYLNQ